MFNIYCDESTHLERDQKPYMILGGVCCPDSKKKEINNRIKEIKENNGLKWHSEIKWGKCSPATLPVYQDIVDYFFDDDDIHFRAVVCPKEILNHDKFNQTHDEWYYKMYYYLLRWFLTSEESYNIYLDIKDTYGGEKINKLREVLCNERYDFDRNMIRKIQLCASHEVQIMQLADVLIGAVNGENRGDIKSPAKRTIVSRVKERGRISLKRTNYSRKFNIFLWSGDA